MPFIQVQHLGMTLEINESDRENRAYFEHCGRHDYHLQQCDQCAMLRFPPSTGCPWCASPASTWTPVEGRGTVHSYFEVHHAVQPGFQPFTPYLVLLVDLDRQKGRPGPHESLRIVGNLVDSDGQLADRPTVEAVGIHSRVKMVFNDLGQGIAIPQWTPDTEEVEEVAKTPVWRYPDVKLKG